MTPEQALQILDGVAAMAPLAREAHIRVQAAVERLRKAVTERDVCKPGDPPEEDE